MAEYWDTLDDVWNRCEGVLDDESGYLCGIVTDVEDKNERQIETYLGCISACDVNRYGAAKRLPKYDLGSRHGRIPARILNPTRYSLWVFEKVSHAMIQNPSLPERRAEGLQSREGQYLILQMKEGHGIPFSDG